MDAWDGYFGSQQRIIHGIRDRGVDNVIMLSGDVHKNYGFDVKENFLDPESATVATEIVGTSVSSGRDGQDLPDNLRTQLVENPHMKFANGQRGYVRFDMTAKRTHVDYRVVPYVLQPGAPISTRASFAIENGKPGLQSIDARGQS